MNDHRDAAEPAQTELTKINEELVLFRKFAEASGQGFGMGDLEGRIAYVNPTMCRLMGEEKPEDVVGKHFMAYYPEGWEERRANEVIPAMEREGHWAGEVPVLSRQGTVTPTLHHAFLLRDVEGRPVRRCIVVTDITERKQTENRLAYLASIPERNPNPIIEVGLGGDVRYMNPAAHRLCPELREQGLKHPWLGNWEVVVQQFGEGQTETAIHEVDVGGRRYQQAFSYVAQDQVIRIYGLDVTERKRAEESLRQSEERFRSYFVQGLIGMAVTARDKQWREVNDRLCEILGYSREELLTMKWTDATHPDDLEPGRLLFNRIVAGEIEHATQDKRFIRKDGKLVYATVFIRCFRRTDGTIDHFLALIEDITERKRIEEALERERRTLKHLLQSSDHERQLIAYEIHDGLAQQLAGAIMQFDTYAHQKDREPRLAAKAFDAGTTMLRQGHFEVRRLISGVRPPILDEAGIVAAIAHLVNEERRKKGPKIEHLSKVEFERLTPILENAMYRIVQEGLNNACRHSKSKRVRVELVQHGDLVRIEVQDQGIGFKPEDIRESHFGVSGIRERARLLGGSAVIESEPGKGTRIVVEVPIVPRREED